MFSYQSASLSPVRDEKLYALIDCTMDAGICRRIAGVLTAANQANLFNGAFAGGAEDYAPVLIDLDAVTGGRQDFMQTLAVACEGKPMLSFISTPATLDKLAEHLRKILLVKTADDQAFLLRYADNRMLPAICSVWTDVQRAAFFGPISTWFVVNHHAEVNILTASKESGESLDQDLYPLKLDDRQLTLLLERTELHSMVAQLEQVHASFSDEFTLAERIQFVERSTEQARAYGFGYAADRLAWCVGALYGGERFYTHEHMIPMLDKALDAAQPLLRSIAEVSQDHWQAIRASRKGD